MKKVSYALLALLAAAGIYMIYRLSMVAGVKAALVLGLVLAAVCVLLWLCSRKWPKAAIPVTLVLLILLAVAARPVETVTDVAKQVTQVVEYETVQIAALKDSGITAEDDFSRLVLGYVNGDDGAYERSSEILVEQEKTVAKSKPYKSAKGLYKYFLEGHTDLMVLTPEVRSDLTDIDEDYEEKIVILFEKSYQLDVIQTREVDIRTEPFTVYLCGTDLSSGANINSTGRGDVNILLSVNPETKKVYLQTIPRDTFVYIPCRGGSSKLSYSGWWGGVQSSIESIEDKFGIEINYYAKINFEGLTDLVDALGGVEVYSHYTYTVGNYSFVKGWNQVNGDQALMFARLRKMLPQNELSRGQHQMELIKGIFRKFAQNPTYDNCMAVLDAMENNFVTNLPPEDYYDAFRLVVELLPQLSEMENHSLDGEYEWHYDEIREGRYQYYYYPYESEIRRVKDSVDAVLTGGEVPATE
ncbi:MAG: LCP family protein [Anaerovoracaceae bacterium]